MTPETGTPSVLPEIRPLPGLAAPEPPLPVCALTVDVEDWYQSCIDFDAAISDRVVRNMELLVETLDSCATKATFFVQGLVADAYPTLVRELVEAGHEVQSHAHTHRPLDRMAPAALRDELARGRVAVEDAAGVPVTAFRAPDFTIGESNLAALDTLAELGFRVDSSIFPLRMQRYGIADWELAPHELALPSGAVLLEAPVAVAQVGKLKIPVAGGGYVRVAPGSVLTRLVDGVAKAGRPPIVYCHPYEFNPHELSEYKGLVPERFRRAQGLGRSRFVPRLASLLRSMRFGRLDDVLIAWGSGPLVARQGLDQGAAETRAP